MSLGPARSFIILFITFRSGSETTESSERKKRAASVGSEKKSKKATVLKKTNAANSMLGLSVVLYPNGGNYDFGVVMNNYIGFKALVYSFFYQYF